VSVLVQVAIVVCALAAWVGFIYLYETRQKKKDLRTSGSSGQTPTSDDRSLNE
jgi:hypothetical protein